jgi:F-type H+-transporting ATPase subunit delta
MDMRVASRYAQSLFEAAQKEKMVTSVSDDLKGILGAMEHDARFGGFLADPTNTRADKLKLVEGVFGDKITALTMQFLRLLLNKRRENILTGVAEKFEELRRANDGTLYASVVSAEELSAAEKQGIISKLETSGKSKVEATFSTDPSIIAGVRVQIGDYVLDGSLKGSMARLKDRLLYDVLKQI